MEIVHFIPATQRRFAMLAAQSDNAPALISGAPGTGKGQIAKWIHANGPRASRPFVKANHDHPLTQQIFSSTGGTLLIPEIGEWPLSEQKNLLQYLNTRSVPHPENPTLSAIADTRIIATTDQSLEGRAQGGLFNSELLTKLNVFRLEMPALTKRAEEFQDIVLGILGEIAREAHKQHLRDLSPDAWNRFKSYGWPGNLRELRNVLKVAVVTAQGELVQVKDFPKFGPDRIDFHATREGFEKTYIVELLKTFGGDVEKTCRVSKIDKNTLMAKMKKYGIAGGSST